MYSGSNHQQGGEGFGEDDRIHATLKPPTPLITITRFTMQYSHVLEASLYQGSVCVCLYVGVGGLLVPHWDTIKSYAAFRPSLGFNIPANQQ